MNNTTRSVLDHAASILAKSFVEDVGHGHTTKAQCDALRTSKKCTSDVEFIKAALRHDRYQVQAGLAMCGSKCNMRNVMKTSYQLNYLANEIVAKIRNSKRPEYVTARKTALAGRS